MLASQRSEPSKSVVQPCYPVSLSSIILDPSCSALPKSQSNPKFSPVVHHRCALDLQPCRSPAPPPAPLQTQLRPTSYARRLAAIAFPLVPRCAHPPRSWTLISRNRSSTGPRAAAEMDPMDIVGKSKEDVSLPKSTMFKIIKEMLPPDVRVARDTQDLLVECCVEFINLLSSESNDVCSREEKKTIAPEHVIRALQDLGFKEYIEEVYAAYEQHKLDTLDSPKASKFTGVEMSEEEAVAEQQRMFAEARARMNNGAPKPKESELEPQKQSHQSLQAQVQLYPQAQQPPQPQLQLHPQAQQPTKPQLQLHAHPLRPLQSQVQLHPQSQQLLQPQMQLHPQAQQQQPLPPQLQPHQPMQPLQLHPQTQPQQPVEPQLQVHPQPQLQLHPQSPPQQSQQTQMQLHIQTQQPAPLPQQPQPQQPPQSQLQPHPQPDLPMQVLLQPQPQQSPPPQSPQLHPQPELPSQPQTAHGLDSS